MTVVLRKHLIWLSHTLNRLRHRTAGGFQPGWVGLRPNTVTGLDGVTLASAARSFRATCCGGASIASGTHMLVFPLGNFAYGLAARPRYLLQSELDT